MQASDSSATSEAEYVDERVLAQRTPLARVTWQKMRADETGPPYYKVGRRCLYRWDEVTAWLDSTRVTPNSPELPRRAPHRGK